MIRKSFILYAICFVAGIILVNGVGSSLLHTYGMISFWDQAAVTFWNLSYDQYFWYLFFGRMKGMILILLLGVVFDRRVLTKICISLFLFLTGIFLTMSVLERGIAGIVAVLFAMLPQWIFYLIALVFFEKGRDRKVILLCFVLVLIGCLLEGYISPFFLKKVL